MRFNESQKVNERYIEITHCDNGDVELEICEGVMVLAKFRLPDDQVDRFVEEVVGGSAGSYQAAAADAYGVL
jgi:hypothetical protein